MCETTSKVHCFFCQSFWTKGIVYCTCGTCLCITDKTRKLNKDRFDTLSIPNYVIKKGPTHGGRHGNTEEQRPLHMAYNAWKRCRKKKYDGILDRFLNSRPRFRASHVEHWWTEQLCAKYGALAREDHSNTYTTRELQRIASTSTIHLISSGKNGPMAERTDYAEAVRTKKTHLSRVR